MRGGFSSGARLIEFDTLDSTSLEGKRRAGQGERGPVWILAARQTAGYGRRGAAWRQAPGDVAASFLFELGARVGNPGEISFVAGLAVAETISEIAPAAAPRLKWPNDVIAGEGKIAGVLLELVGAENPVVVMGVGVNIVSKPTGLDYPTARLLDFLGNERRARAPDTENAAGNEAACPNDLTGASFGRNEFLRSLDAAFNRRLALWRKDGFAPVRTAWLDRAAGLGQKIRVRLPHEIIEGIFKDLDQSGALVLDCGGARRFFSAGAALPGLEGT